MRKVILPSLLLIAVLLSACGAKSTTAISTPTPAVTVQPTPVGAKPGECELSPSFFQARSAAEATYAPISSTDHVLGPDTALMTVIEYSDFT